MCHASVLEFGPRALAPSHVRGRGVLEVGSLNVNGSLRRHVESLRPASYLGVDFRSGRGVDLVADATDPDFPVKVNGPYSVVICTEMLEHVLDWRAAVRNIKACVRFGGHLLVTTRSLGFHFHEYPGDYWRYELSDMERIFADFTIDLLEPDPQAPGVFFYATALSAPAVDLSGVELYSMQSGVRC
jgi:hypothetical protein